VACTVHWSQPYRWHKVSASHTPYLLPMFRLDFILFFWKRENLFRTISSWLYALGICWFGMDIAHSWHHRGVSTVVVIVIAIAATCLAIILLTAFYFKVFSRKNTKGKGEFVFLL
jgi:ABC-type phosphate/phosphonate transport system permease subunit